MSGTEGFNLVLSLVVAIVVPCFIDASNGIRWLVAGVALVVAFVVLTALNPEP